MFNIKIELKKIKNNVLYKDININLGNGIYLLKGENSVGKTTLFNIMYKLDEDYVGEIYFNDKNIKNIETSTYRSNYITYVNQEFNLFTNLTPKENIKLLVLLYENGEYEKLVKGLKLEEIINSNKTIKNFSGGEIQKVKLLIGLLHKTPILLLDEPDNNLDEESLIFLSEYLLKEQKLIIISSHILDEFISEKDINILEIVDRKIKVKNSKLETNTLKISLNNLEINNMFFQKLSNKFKLQRRLIYGISIILIFVTWIIISHFLIGVLIYSSFNEGVSYNMDDNVIQIYSPVLNQMFSVFGTEDAVDKIPFYFGTKEYNSLKSRDDIKYIQPIGGLVENGHYTYDVNINMDLSTLEYDKYNLEDYYSGETLPVIQNSCIEPKRVNTHGLEACMGFDELSYGEYPKDNTDEILLDEYTAMYYASENGLDSLEDVIGQKIDIIVTNIDEEKTEHKEFIVSGIGMSYESPTFATAYKSNTHEDYINHPWIPFPEGEEGSAKVDMYNMMSGTYEGAGVTPPTIDEIPDPENNAYPGFYIEMNSKEDVGPFIEELKAYEPYITIKSNYANTHTSSFFGLKSYILKNLKIIALTFLLFIIIVFLLMRYYVKSIEKVVKNLKYFGFKEQNIKNYIKFNDKKLLKGILLEIIGGLCIIAVMLVLGLEFELILVIVICIIVYLIIAGIGLKVNRFNKRD